MPGSRATAHRVKEIFTLAPVTVLQSLLSAPASAVVTGEAAAGVLERALGSTSPEVAHVAFAATHGCAHSLADAQAQQPHSPYFPAVYIEAYAGARSPQGQPLLDPPPHQRPHGGAGTKAFCQPSSMTHVSLAAMALTADALCIGAVKRIGDGLSAVAEEFQPRQQPAPPPAEAAASSALPPPPASTLRPTLSASALGAEDEAPPPPPAAPAAPAPPPWSHTGIELGVGVVNLHVLPTLANSGGGPPPPVAAGGGATAAPASLGSSPAFFASSMGVSLPLATVLLSRAFVTSDAASVLKLRAPDYPGTGRHARGASRTGADQQQQQQQHSASLSWHGGAGGRGLRPPSLQQHSHHGALPSSATSSISSIVSDRNGSGNLFSRWRRRS
jgi:hypothetical protein